MLTDGVPSLFSMSLPKVFLNWLQSIVCTPYTWEIIKPYHFEQQTRMQIQQYWISDMQAKKLWRTGVNQKFGTHVDIITTRLCQWSK